MTDIAKLEEFKADLRALLTKYNCEICIKQEQEYQAPSILFECMNWLDTFEYDAGSWVNKDTV